MQYENYLNIYFVLQVLTIYFGILMKQGVDFLAVKQQSSSCVKLWGIIVQWTLTSLVNVKVSLCYILQIGILFIYIQWLSFSRCLEHTKELDWFLHHLTRTLKKHWMTFSLANLALTRRPKIMDYPKQHWLDMQNYIKDVD